MNILITGAAGNLGSFLARYLVSGEHKGLPNSWIISGSQNKTLIG
ncbi:MAG: NAD(P)-dependent oxidoreductase [Ignavibacteriae bacterium]|nr:NAD(P)-dependent oxidoreductase [Ignavibacteriota bacterium]